MIFSYMRHLFEVPEPLMFPVGVESSFSFIDEGGKELAAYV